MINRFFQEAFALRTAVPAPWTPVTAREGDDGLTVAVWGREYCFGGDALPLQITAAGEKLLASPMRLTGLSNGGEILWETRSNLLLSQSDRSVTVAGSLESRLLIANTSIRIDFDGYMEIKLRISPRGMHIRTGVDVQPDPVRRTLSRLWLEVPLRTETASLMDANGWSAGANYSGAVREGQWAFMPSWWIGNERVGLGLYADSDEHWQPEDPGCAAEIVPSGESVLLRWHFLDSQPQTWAERDAKLYPQSALEKRTLTEKLGIGHGTLHYQFALQATPIKEFDASYIRQNILHIDCFSKIQGDYADYLLDPLNDGLPGCRMDHIREKGVNVLTLHEKWQDIEGYWIASPKRAAQTKQIVEQAHLRGIKVMAYFTSSWSSLRDEDEAYVARNAHIDHNGERVTSHYRQPPQRQTRMCANGPDVHRDLIAGIEQAVEQFKFDGVYLDSADIPWDCTNESHGCGYTDFFGFRRPTYPITSMRLVFMELYERLHPKGKLIHLHSYSAYIPAIHGCCDLYWNGEQLVFSRTFGDMVDLPLDFIRTQCLGRNIGVPCQFLAYELPGWTFERALSFTAVHGVYPRPNDAAHPLDAMAPVWKALARFDAAVSRWIPYWEPGVPAQTLCEGILISAYVRERQALIIVSNPTGGEKNSVCVRADGIWVRDALTGEDIASKDDVTLSLPPFTMRMLLMEISDGGKKD